MFGCFLSDTSASNGPTNGSPSLPLADNQSSKQVTNEKPAQTLAQQEQDFFNQIPNEKEKAKMTKDSILALYGAAPTINRLSTTNQYNPAQSMNMQQPSAFAIPNNINNFQQFGMMQGQTQQPMNQPQQSSFMGFGDFSMANPSMQQFAQPPIANQNTARTVNSSQMHFGDLSLANPSIQSFTQPMNINQNLPFNNTASATPSNAASTVNQQFGNLNLGNVWQ